MEIKCDALIMPTLLVLFPIGSFNRVNASEIIIYFSTVNGEDYLFRGCSPFNTDEIFADNRLHDPVGNIWNNDENWKQHCDRDSFCNRGDMKIGKSEAQILNIKKSKNFEILKKNIFQNFIFGSKYFFFEKFFLKNIFLRNIFLRNIFSSKMLRVYRKF